MLNQYKTLFLRQSYLDSYDTYKLSLSPSAVIWDYVILTASNEAQAKAYNEQIEYRIKAGVLPAATKYAVISDLDGKRCGSGGATLAVLKYIAEVEGSTNFYKLRILCIHSGGDSKRVPQYSACGKIFSPVPRMLLDDRRSTLFDEFIIGMSGIPSRIASGMLVCSGDVLLLLNPLQLDFYGEGATALSIKENVQTGRNHGVFLGGEDGKVKRFLHKQTVEHLTELGAVDKRGSVDLDTGAVIFSGGLVNALYSLVDTNEKYAIMVNDHVRLSFYADFLYPLAKDNTLEDFYLEQPEGDFSPELGEARKLIWEALHEYTMKLVRFSPASFLHFGTTCELLKLMTEDMPNYRFLDWSNVVNSNYHGSDCAVYNSYISSHAKIGNGCYIEDSDIHSGTCIGEGSIVSGVTLKDVSVPGHTVIHGLKLADDRFVVRMYGINDNPKEIKWLGQVLDEPLWTKPLFPVRSVMEEAVKATLTGDNTGILLSLKDSFNQADVTQILPWQSKLDDKIKVESILEAVYNSTPVSEIIKSFPNGISERVERYLLYEADRLDENILDQFSRKIRIYYYASQLTGREILASKCFDTICSAILNAALKHTAYNPENHIAKTEVITRLPVRVNWGGGWSDTPPYCLEHGGTVLNAAVTLNGQLPIEVTLRRLDEPKIILASTDIGSYKEFTEISELQKCHDPSDAFALHKAALIACSVIPYKEIIPLTEICNNLGGGLYMNTRVINVPKGSGLGTSSILAGACVKGLFTFLDIKASDNELYNRVLCMEQIMSTGGGWQDQVGGLAPGIKMVTAAPSLEQQIVCTPLVMTNEALKELDERFALIYTGQRRLARNLLRGVIGKYIGSELVPLNILYRIQQMAVLMRFELERGNIDGIAKLMDEHWELSKKLDAGCTNTCIDQIFIAIEDLIDGRMICGAGGGGFVQVIMKKGITVKTLQERLDDVFADSGVGAWDCEFMM
jgi:Predicted kinase related to galactokinase and mevalonate kinase